MFTEKRMRRLVLILLGWLALIPAYAAAPSASSANYEVEVLVFEMQLAEFEGSELWTQQPRPADATTAAPEGMPPTADFEATMAAMRIDGRYRVLLHKRWLRTAESKSTGPALPLATDDSEINGTLKFYLSRFLHVELNVAYQPRAGAIGAYSVPGSGTPAFVINEQRRVRSNELNYFDHPKFGVLVRVAPAAAG